MEKLQYFSGCCSLDHACTPSALTCGCKYPQGSQAPSCLIFHSRSGSTGDSILLDHGHVIACAQLGPLGSKVVKTASTTFNPTMVHHCKTALHEGTAGIFQLGGPLAAAAEMAEDAVRDVYARIGKLSVDNEPHVRIEILAGTLQPRAGTLGAV